MSFTRMYCSCLYTRVGVLTPTQYQCCSQDSEKYSGIEEAL